VVERNSRYDGVYVFKLLLSKLLPGDIILTRNREASGFKGRRQSDIIAKATRGNFSHAMICTTLPTAVEALGDGVATLSLTNTFCHTLENLRVLRYPDRTLARAAASKAMMFLGQGYSVRDAVLSVMPGTTQPQRVSEGTFCSALVATAFCATEAPEFVGVEPLRRHPETSNEWSISPT
jgi:hypothetical protein